MTALACEVRASLLFVPEFSPKAAGSVRETAIASKMMFISHKRETAPKDLGIDLLQLKEKHRVEEPYDEEIERGVPIARAERDEAFVEDPAGWFKIEVDRKNGLIAAIHHTYKERQHDIVVKGQDAQGLYQTIIRKGLASRLDHAAYLGRELEKAEIALHIRCLLYTSDAADE